MEISSNNATEMYPAATSDEATVMDDYGLEPYEPTHAPIVSEAELFVYEDGTPFRFDDF